MTYIILNQSQIVRSQTKPFACTSVHKALGSSLIIEIECFYECKAKIYILNKHK